MGSVSPRVRTMGRGIALVFAAAVVIVRLGIAACSPAVVGPGPAFVGPTKAGGGFNSLEPEQAPPAPQNAAAPSRRDAAAVREEELGEPDYFPPTKAGGGFYARPRRAAAPQQQAGGDE